MQAGPSALGKQQPCSDTYVRDSPLKNHKLLPRQSRRVSAAATRKEVTLLDYGAGNVRSVRNAIMKLGYNIKDVRR